MELLSFVIWIFILVRTIVAESLREQIINGALFAVLIVFGYLLIRNVNQQVETREKIESLASDLKKKAIKVWKSPIRS